MSYVIKTKNSESVIRLSREKAKSGATGDVYSLEGTEDFVFKKYKAGAVDLKLMLPQLEHFIANPPKFSGTDEEVLGVKFHTLAWPRHIVYQKNKPVGFLMPKISFDESIALNRMLSVANRKKNNITEDINWRILVAKNLAATYAALHAEKYYVIDTKPANIRAYKKFQGITILDCDGFMLGGSPFTAKHITDEYIAPEFDASKIDKVARRQDVFALSVLIFRLFNNNIHPFSGVLKVKQDLNTQARINKGAYPYGSRGSSLQDPNPTSVHHLFPQKLAQMFDEIFGNGKRPQAKEWVDLLEGLRDARGQTNCPKHIIKTFKRGCGVCHLEKVMKGATSSIDPSNSNSTPIEKAAPHLSSIPSTQKSSAHSQKPSADNGSMWIFGLLGLVIVGGLILNTNDEPDGRNATSSHSNPPNSSSVVSSNKNSVNTQRDLCKDNHNTCSNEDLCYWATAGSRWDTNYTKHVNLAKSRGLTCEVAGAAANANVNTIRLNPNNWVGYPNCVWRRSHPRTDYYKTELAVTQNDGLQFRLYKRKSAFEMDTSALTLYAPDKDPFEVEGRYYQNDGERYLGINNLNLFKGLFAMKNQVTVLDGRYAIEVSLSGSKRVIDKMTQLCGLE